MKSGNLTEKPKQKIRNTFSARDLEMMMYVLKLAQKSGIEQALQELKCLQEVKTSPVDAEVGASLNKHSDKHTSIQQELARKLGVYRLHQQLVLGQVDVLRHQLAREINWSADTEQEVLSDLLYCHEETYDGLLHLLNQKMKTSPILARYLENSEFETPLNVEKRLLKSAMHKHHCDEIVQCTSETPSIDEVIKLGNAYYTALQEMATHIAKKQGE